MTLWTEGLCKGLAWVLGRWLLPRGPLLIPAAQAGPPHPCYTAPSFRNVVPHPGPHCPPSPRLLMPSCILLGLAGPSWVGGGGSLGCSGVGPEAPLPLPEGSLSESESGVSSEAIWRCFSPRLSGPQEWWLSPTPGWCVGANPRVWGYFQSGVCWNPKLPPRLTSAGLVLSVMGGRQNARVTPPLVNDPQFY